MTPTNHSPCNQPPCRPSHVSCRSGVLAIILFIWMFVRIVSTLTRQWRWSTAAETQWLLVAVAVVTVGFATRNLFDYMFAGSLTHLF
jgi:hypothetical protein